MEINKQSATTGNITYYMKSDYFRVTLKSVLVGRFTVDIETVLPSIPALDEFLASFELNVSDLKYRAIRK